MNITHNNDNESKMNNDNEYKMTNDNGNNDNNDIDNDIDDDNDNDNNNDIMIINDMNSNDNCSSNISAIIISLILRAVMDSLRGSSVKIGTIQRRLAWPLRKDDTHKSKSVLILRAMWPQPHGFSAAASVTPDPRSESRSRKYNITY